MSEGDGPGHNEVGDLIRGPWPELVDLDALSSTDEPAPAVVPDCRCGNVTVRGHNGFTCDQVLAIRARVDADTAYLAARVARTARRKRRLARLRVVVLVDVVGILAGSAAGALVAMAISVISAGGWS